MATAPDTNRDLTPAELVRVHEANCGIEYAMPEEQNFRVAWMKLLARKVGLAELKTLNLTGAGKGVQRPNVRGNA